MKSMQKEINMINNIKYMLDGYGLCALEKMIPTDVPVIFIHGRVTEEVICFLDKVMEKSCIIGVGEAAVFLLERKIKVDFITFLDDTEFEAFEKSEVWKSVPIISDTNIPAWIFEEHIGKIFFFASGNEIENVILGEALDRNSGIYRYNNLTETKRNNLKENLLFFGAFMGDSYTMLLEGTTEEAGIIEVFEETLRVGRYHISDSKLLQYFTVPVDTTKIISWLIPLFDGDSKEYLVDGYNRLRPEFEQLKGITLESLELYEKLYELVIQDVVSKAELDDITNHLNRNTAKLEAFVYISYLLNLSETVSVSMEEREKPNEVAEVALDAICQLRKLEIVLEKLMMEIRTINQADIHVEPHCRRESKTIENILLVAGRSQYGVLPHFVEGLKEGFQKQMLFTYMCDANNKEKLDMVLAEGYNHFQNTVGYQYVLLMNGVFLEWQRYDSIQKCYKNSFDNKNSKLLPMFVDHPVLHKRRLNYAHTAFVVLFADGNWVEYVKRNLKDIPNPLFLPLGGLERKGAEHIEYSDRTDKVVFFCSYADISEMEEQINCHEYAAVIWKIVEELKNNPDMTIEAVVDKVEEENMTSYTTHNIVYETDVFWFIDSYIRQFYRQKVVDKVIRAGIPIEIYGWKNTSYGEYPNVTMKEAVSFDEMLDICNKVKFVLNVQPWTKSGTQERVFNTMLCGAVAITDETDYLREKTTDGTNILLYELKEMDKLPDKIQYYMNHEEEAEQIAKNGFELAKTYHTWECRAAELIKLLEQEGGSDANN